MLSTRRPARPNPAKVPISRGASLPPPVGGLNAVDELADMDPRDALIMDNVFPEASYVSVRRGHEAHVTGLPGAVESLMEWAGPGGNELFAASDGDIYDVTSPGAVGAAVVTGQASDRWQHVNISTAGGHFLLMVNGADAPQNYNGTAWATTPAITGVTAADLINVAIHKNRAWFVELDSATAWYLAPSSIGGAATAFPLGAVFREGGKLITIGTVSQDSGDGPDDYLAFVSSKGEVAVYEGTDPGSVTTWGLVGVYRVGVPIGYRCLVKAGGDLGIITSDGVVSMIQMAQADRSTAERAAITAKIQPLFNAATQAYSGLFGWQAMTYPRGNWVICNFPESTTTFKQFVMNSITGAWCRFTNLNAVCWSLLGEDVFFGGADGVVYQADSSFQDQGGPITARLQTAWNYFKSRGQNKLFTMLRPIIGSNGAPGVLITMNTDFKSMAPTGTLSVSVPPDSLWGVSLWGVGVWGGDTVTSALWTNPANWGYCASIRMLIVCEGQSFVLNSFDVQYQMGGPL